MTPVPNAWMIRTMQIIVGIAGLGALTLGLLFWIANIQLINIHMLLGLIVALILLIVSFIALFTRDTRDIRISAIVGVVYALIVPAFGLTQSRILTGNLHWLIQILHMLVGLGAIVLAGGISARYMQLKRINVRTVAAPQSVHYQKRQV